MENKVKNSEAEDKLHQLIASYCEEAGEAQLPIEFRLVTNATIRKRGTEPLLRFYIESDEIKKLEELKAYIKNNVK